MSIILVRHGETALNVSRVLQPPDTPLSQRGQAQARAVALRLADEPVAALVSSDLLRTADGRCHRLARTRSDGGTLDRLA